jgi:hypothetical protein
LAEEAWDRYEEGVFLQASDDQTAGDLLQKIELFGKSLTGDDDIDGF